MLLARGRRKEKEKRLRREVRAHRRQHWPLAEEFFINQSRSSSRSKEHSPRFCRSGSHAVDKVHVSEVAGFGNRGWTARTSAHTLCWIAADVFVLREHRRLRFFSFFFEKGKAREKIIAGAPLSLFSLARNLLPPPLPNKDGLRRRLPWRLGRAGRPLLGQAAEAAQDDEVFQGAPAVSSRHEPSQLGRDAGLDRAQDRGAARLRGRGAQRLHRRAAGGARGKRERSELEKGEKKTSGGDTFSLLFIPSLTSLSPGPPPPPLF